MIHLLQKKNFCAKCKKLVVSSCSKCGKIAKIWFFREIPVIFQLSYYFRIPGYEERLQHRLKRNKTNKNLEDIYDGSAYKSFVSLCFNVPFMWNTDDILIFKSSKFSYDLFI